MTESSQVTPAAEDSAARGIAELIESNRGELAQLVDLQGGFSGIDQKVKTELAEFGNLVVTNGRQKGLPFIWGSIRILAIYGKWSWWRDPPRPPSPI